MKLKKSIIYILILSLVISMVGCRTKDLDNKEDYNIAVDSNIEEKVIVAVSIVPQETFVKAVAGDLVDIITMIPPGNSPANYQPTPKQMTKLSESKLYFSIGVPTEKANILTKLEDFNEKIKVVALADIVGEVYPHRTFGEEEHNEHDEHEDCHHDHGEVDPHIWLSPKRVKVMVESIKNELTDIDPQNKDIYEKNAKAYIAKLNEVDYEIKEILSKIEQNSFIIYHPAFGYFADDYGLKMVTIEEDGKQTTAQSLQNVIDFAKKENIKFVFYQEEFDSKQAEIVAKEIGGATAKVAPLAPDYIENLKNIANTFRRTLN